MLGARRRQRMAVALVRGHSDMAFSLDLPRGHN